MKYQTCVDDSEDVWCGDAKYEPNIGNVYDNLEVCDDGNNVSGDGCSADCKKIEIGFQCDIVPSAITGYDKSECYFKNKI